MNLWIRKYQEKNPVFKLNLLISVDVAKDKKTS